MILFKEILNVVHEETFTMQDLLLLSIWVDDGDVEVASAGAESFHSKASVRTDRVALRVQTYTHTHQEAQLSPRDRAMRRVS